MSTAVIPINRRHRRHWKSGSCLSAHPLGHDSFSGRKFRMLLELATVEGQRRTALARPEYFERSERSLQPRSTRSLFGRIASKVLGLFGKKAA